MFSNLRNVFEPAGPANATPARRLCANLTYAQRFLTWAMFRSVPAWQMQRRRSVFECHRARQHNRCSACATFSNANARFSNVFDQNKRPAER